MEQQGGRRLRGEEQERERGQRREEAAEAEEQQEEGTWERQQFWRQQYRRREEQQQEHGEEALAEGEGEHDALARIAALDVNALFASQSGTTSGSQPSIPSMFPSPRRADRMHARDTYEELFASSRSEASVSTSETSSRASSRSAHSERRGVISCREATRQHEDEPAMRDPLARPHLRRIQHAYQVQVQDLEGMLEDARLKLIQCREKADAKEWQLLQRIEGLSSDLEKHVKDNQRMQASAKEERSQWQRAVDEMTQRYEADKRRSEQEHMRLKAEVDELRTALEQSREETRVAQATIKRLKKQDVRLSRIEELESDLRAYHTEMSAMKTALDNLSDEYTSIDKEHAQLRKRHQETEHANKMLAQDKLYLEKQLAREQNTVSILNSQLSDLQLKLRSAEAKTREAQEQLDTQLAEQRRVLEETVAGKLAELKRRNDEEMDNIKRSNESVQLRELDLMRRDREQAMQAQAVAEAKLQSLERKHTEEVDDLKERVRELEGQLSHAQADAKLKAFEHDRTSMLLEEKQQQVRSLELKVERLQEECKVVREEYQRLETDAQRRTEKMQRELDDATTKISAFTKLEDELDHVVMAAAESSDPHQVLLSYGYGSNTQRRVQKTLELARQLLEARRSQATAEERAEAATTELEDTRRQLQEAQTLVNNASQPLSYFMHMLAEKDDRVQSLNTRVGELEDAVTQHERAHERLMTERDELYRHAHAGQRHTQHLRDLRAKFKDMLAQLREQGEDTLVSALTHVLKSQASSRGGRRSKPRGRGPIFVHNPSQA